MRDAGGEGIAGRLRRVGAAAGGRGRIPPPLRRLGKAIAVRLVLRRQRRKARAMRAGPRFALLLPLRGGDREAARRTVHSVLRQSYPHWTLYLVAEDPGGEARAASLKTADARVAVWRGGAAALNEAASASGADFVAVVHEGDQLSPGALFQVAQLLADDRGADVVYTDEAVRDGPGVRAVLKPDWSPETVLFRPYVGGLCCFRRAVALEAGGFRPGFGAAREYDLLLRTAGEGARVVHLRELLYVRPAGAPPPPAAHAHPDFHRALDEHLARAAGEGRRPPAEVGGRGVRFRVRGAPLVSIVIPTAAMTRTVGDRRVDLLANCVSSIVERSTWGRYEVVCVHNGGLAPETVAVLDALPAPRTMVQWDGPFNVAAKMNLGAAYARGEHLLFLNDDVEVISPDWMEALLEYSQQEPIGTAGAKLRFPGGAIQHAGVVVGGNGSPGHVHYAVPPADEGGVPELSEVRNYSAVTGACMMTRAGVFREVGGFTEAFPVNYNDVDYCLKVRDRGYRLVFTPFAELFHFESVSRATSNEDGVRPHELRQFTALWSGPDPYLGAGSASLFLPP